MSKQIAFSISNDGFGEVEYNGVDRDEVDRLLGGLGLDMGKPKLAGLGRSTTERATFSPQSPELDGLEERVATVFRDKGYEIGVM